MSFRFVHTADLHLDAPLRSLGLRDPELAEEVGVASRQAFSRIIDLCLSEKAAFLLIAGDLWDGSHSSTKTPRFLKQELLRLKEAGIGCFIIRGNHDAMALKTGELDLPDNTHLFGARAGSVELTAGGQRVAIHGLSFKDSAAPDSLLPRYPAPLPGAINIGLMHTSLNGSPGHDSYAPCSLADLQAQGYDYWALGHIHRRAVYEGTALVVMPGIPQGRDIGEPGEGSATLVTVSDAGRLTAEPRVVAGLRFERLAIDCTPFDSRSALLNGLEAAIRAAARAPRQSPHLVLRPVFTGLSPLAWVIRRDLDRLTEEARAFAGAAGVWIDRVELNLSTAAGATLPGGLPPELADLVLRDMPGDPALSEAMAQATEDLLRDLPPELRDLFGADEAGREAALSALLAEGAPLVLAALAPGDGAEGEL